MKNCKLLLIFSVLLISCEQEISTSIVEEVKLPNFEIIPPLISDKPKAELFKIDNSEDTILISENGGYISIPKNCFLDNQGKEVKEGITISFNEYLNPTGILLSGIPMVYMAGEDTMDFQSAGMCEVLAKTDNGQLNLIEDKEIGIGLRNLAQDNDYNLYYFDTLKRNWFEKEKDLPVILANQLPIKPVNLQTADSDDILQVNVDNHIVRPMYKMWHKSKFCIYGENKLMESDSTVWWYDMTINPTENKDLYDLTFNGVDDNSMQWTYNLTVQPTIDSADYDLELELFEQNMRAYVNEIELVKNQIEQSLAEGLKIEAEFDVNRKRDSIRYAIQWQQDSLDMVQWRIDDSLRLAQQNINDSIKLIQVELWKSQQAEKYKSEKTRIEVVRSFNIKQMGIYNCDRFYKRPILATKSIKMLVNNQARHFDKSYLVNVKANAVLNYLKFSVDSYQIDLDLDDYVFVGVLEGDIYATNISLKYLDVEMNLMPMKQISLLELKHVLG